MCAYVSLFNKFMYKHIFGGVAAMPFHLQLLSEIKQKAIEELQLLDLAGRQGGRGQPAWG